jgi:hypothetical protein
MWAVNWRRLARRAFIAGALVAAAVQLYYSAHGSEYGLDFHGGTWNAGRALLAGRSPYPPPAVGVRLMLGPSGFMNPPPLALFGIVFAWLRYWEAIAAFNLVCAAALVTALRALGVRDRRFYVLALCSFPFISSLALGQPDGLLALLAAGAWQCRDQRWRGALCAGALIAAKLLAWPLIIWLLATRRASKAAVAAASTVGILLATWASIGFAGLTTYPKLLADDARTYEYQSHSLVSAFMHAGISAHVAVALAVIGAACLATAVVQVAGGSDAGWFSAALIAGILSSPIVWDHYLVLLFVCMAASGGLRDRTTWLLTAALWACPVENPATLWQAWLVPLLVSAIALRLAFLGRAGPTACRRSIGTARLYPAPSSRTD